MILAATLAACLPFKTPGDTTSIHLVSTSTIDGWRYDYYRNLAYPCSVSGYQTFVIGRRIESSDTSPAPLWTVLHGGGVGYFDAAGRPIPGITQKVEESAVFLRGPLLNNGLLARVRSDPAGFRTLGVSYCSHDMYAGLDTIDPHNPNTTPQGSPRTTNGLLATKAAIQFVQASYPTTKTFLHGTSAGSAGAFGVAWSMQLQGIPPAGVIADSGLVNVDAFTAGYALGVCPAANDPARLAAIAARMHPSVATTGNEPDQLVSSRRLTVPVMHIWNHGDAITCGAAPVVCPLRDGTVEIMGHTDCIHEPLRRAIVALGLSRSRNYPVCVDHDDIPDCSTHVVTNKVGLTNTDPSTPIGYNGGILHWVLIRLGD